MKVDTKHTILSVATDLFNLEGFGKVSMNEIAKSAGLSRGNLAYHFKDKDTLLGAIVDKMWQKLNEKREKSLIFPSFKNLEEEFSTFYEIQKEYAFIFLDSHVLKHPSIQPKVKAAAKKSIRDHKTFLAYSIQIGNLKPEPFKGLYNQLSFLAWMVSFYWLPQQIVRGDFSKEAYKKMIWSFLLPHFTEKGLKSFTKYIGKDVLDTIGEPFESSIEDLLNLG